MVFAIERRKACKSACSGILRVVEPKAYVKSVGRFQGNVWIEAKDLVGQNRMQRAENLARGVRLKVCLIPGEPENS